MISTIATTVRQLTVKGANTAWSTSTSPEHLALDIAVLFDMTRRAPQNFAYYREFAITEAIEALSAAQAIPHRGATIPTSGS